MAEMGDISYDGAGDVMASLGHPAEMPPSNPSDTQPGACPECGAPMDGNVCSQCGYSHETPVPPENTPTPSMSAQCGIELGRVIKNIATQAIATQSPDELATLGGAAKDFADALKTVSPPPSVPDPTKLEQLDQQAADAQRQQADSEAQRAHDAVQAEADHQRSLEQSQVQHEQGLEASAAQAEQQAAQPQNGGGNGGN